SGHSATLLPSGKVLAAGGGGYLASAELYQPAPVVLTPAYGSTLNNNRPTFSGPAAAGSTVTVRVDETAMGDPTANASGEWAFLPPPARRSADLSGHSATSLPSGKALAAGGGGYLASAEPYQPAPVVLTPAHGSILNINQPTFSGTAEAESTVTVWLDET